MRARLIRAFGACLIKLIGILLNGRILIMTVTVLMYIIGRETQGSIWREHQRLELTRIPSVGEFIDTHSSVNRPNDDWNKVVMVIHTPSEAGCDANVFVEPIDYHEAFPER
jgi:hypothetical protein